MGRESRYSRGMQYAILRVQKLKSAVAVHRSMKHAFRAQDTPNADPALTPDNTHIGAQNVTEGMAAFRARLPEVPKGRCAVSSNTSSRLALR